MHIRPASLSDTSAIGELSAAAMDNDDLTGLHGFLTPYGHNHPLSRRETFIRRCKSRFYDPRVTMLVMVIDQNENEWDGHERIVGHVAISSTVPPVPSPLVQRLWLSFNGYIHKAKDTARWYLHTDQSQSNANVSAYRRTQSGIDEADYLVPEGRDYFFIDHLSVDPDYQRLGIGRALVEHAQQQAAAENLPILLVSSNVAEKLYLSCGFKEIAKLPVADGLDSMDPLMLWEPLASLHAEQSG